MVLRSAASASGELLRCSMQHCCVQLVANAEEFGGIDAVLSIKGDPPCLHGPLDGRTGDIAGTGSFREGKLGHGRSLCGAWVSDSLAMIRQARGRKQGAASDNRLYVTDGLPIHPTVPGQECSQPDGWLQRGCYRDRQSAVWRCSHEQPIRLIQDMAEVSDLLNAPAISCPYRHRLSVLGLA